MTNGEPKINYTSLVSILMPCYNHETYVISSLESVAASDYKLIEFIFIDDASKDNSFIIAQKWFEENKNRFVRTVCIQHEKNCGICATFNDLYALSHGEYVSYLASDDLLLEKAISKQVKFAQKNEVDFIFSDCQLIDESAKIISNSALQYFGKNSEIFKWKVCLAADIIFFWGVPYNKFFMKSNLVDKLGAFDKNLCFEDRDFIIRVLINGSYKFMQDVTTAYRYRLYNRNNTKRETPGLIYENIMSDFHKADCKNYLNSTGLFRIMLGITVKCYDESCRELKIKNGVFLSFIYKSTRLFVRLVIRSHRIIYQLFKNK